jgi:glutamine amidotransferase
VNGPVIVDAGGANIASLQIAMERLGRPATLSSDAAEIERGSHVILPGVGAAADAMERLERAGLVSLIPRLRQPVLGICLGMQLLYEASEEGGTRCLGVIPGRVRRMRQAAGRPVPHMGWNRVAFRREHALLAGLEDGEFAYFVHSYCAPVGADTVAACEYDETFTAVACNANFFGAQFHPERSARLGSRFLANFLGLG